MALFIIVNIPFTDWKFLLYNNKKIICINEEKIEKYKKFNLVPISINDYVMW